MARARPLGRITVATSGTPVRATVNEGNPAARHAAHSILFERDVTTETGKVYILDREDAVIATRVGVLAVLAIPTDNLLPSFSLTVTSSPNGFDTADFWVDADNDGEGCIVSVIRA